MLYTNVLIMYTIVQYKVKTDKAVENINFIKQVFEDLIQKAPEGVHYTSLQSEDGLHFTHIALFDTDDDRVFLTQGEAFLAFQKGIKERCEIPPKAVKYNVVGNYLALQ